MSKENDFINIIEQTTDHVFSDEEVIHKLPQCLEKETDLDLKDAQQTVRDISETIDIIDDNFKDLQHAKEHGTSRKVWLKDRLDDTIHQHNIENTEEFISEIKDSLKESNAKIGTVVFDKDIEISKPLTSSKYNDINKIAIVHDFQEEIKNNTLLGAVVFENGSISIDGTHKEIKAVKNYFEAQLDSPQDKNFKKAISTATVIGQKTGKLPKQIENKTPDEIAMIVDKGVTAAKVSYKLGKGELSPLDAVEYTIDRNVAVLNSAITRTCTRTGGIYGGKIGAVLGSVFGPAGTVVGSIVGTVLGKVGGYAVGRFICEGAKKVANAVKSVAKKAWEGVKSFASKLNPFNWF